MGGCQHALNPDTSSDMGRQPRFLALVVCGSSTRYVNLRNLRLLEGRSFQLVSDYWKDFMQQELISGSAQTPTALASSRLGVLRFWPITKARILLMLAVSWTWVTIQAPVGLSAKVPTAMNVSSTSSSASLSHIPAPSILFRLVMLLKL